MKPNAKFINTEKIEGYVYSTGSNFNQLSERVSGENSKNPGTKIQIKHGLMVVKKMLLKFSVLESLSQ